MRLLRCLIFITACAGAASAQAETPRVEVFGGYSHLRQERVTTGEFSSVNGFTPAQVQALLGAPVTTNRGRAGLNGFDVSVTGYLTKRFGLTGDFSGNFETETQTFFGLTTRARLRTFGLLGGPQLKFFNRSRLTPFARALFGVKRTNNRVTGPLAVSVDNNTGFAMALGGGLDVRAGRRFDVRLIQADYNPVFLRDRQVIDTIGNTFALREKRRDDLRLAFGVVFKF